MDDDLLIVEDDLPPPRRRNDFMSARNIPEGVLISPLPTPFSKRLPRTRGPNRPFVPPLKGGGNRIVPADGLVQTTLSVDNQPSRRLTGNGQIHQTESNSDLAWAMDFEQRKMDATRRRREELRATQPGAGSSNSSDTISSSPHRNRYNAAISSLEVGQSCSEAPGQVKEHFRTTLSDNDPRAYLMRRQKSFVAKKVGPGDRPTIMRAKSTRLPLETIPKADHLHKLVQNVSTDMENFRRVMAVLAKEDMYVNRGYQNKGLVMSSSGTPGVSRKVQQVVNLWMKKDASNKYEVKYSFSNLLDSESLGS